MIKYLLSVDQSTSCSGYALFKNGELIKYGKVSFDGELIERIYQVKNWLSNVIDVIRQDSESDSEIKVILEDIQYQPNYEKKTEGAVASVTTFKSLAFLLGCLLVMLHEKNTTVQTYFASEWKSTFSIKGKGRTEQKHNAQACVLENFKIKATQDECDAILLGYHGVLEDNKVVNWG